MPPQKNLRDNLIKNSVILIVAALFLPILDSSFSTLRSEQISDLLLIISILLVTVCFANFAFTYEKSKLSTPMGRLLSHGATFTFMLLILLLLETTALAVRVVYPSFSGFIFLFVVLLYFGIILYDFWDYLRAQQ